MIVAVLVAQVFVAGREPLPAKALGRPVRGRVRRRIGKPIPSPEKRRAHL
jgi:hypothetical protein